MGKVTFRHADGSEDTFDGQADYSLMEIAVRNGVAGIEGDCGGVLACATCHVYVSDQWLLKTGEASELEKHMLEMAENVRPESRLCCQIPYRAELDGIVLDVPEVS